MMRFNTIIIANVAEVFEGVISKIQFPNQQRVRIDIEHSLCDRSLLWNGDSKVVVTPFSISETLFKKNLEVFSFKNVVNFSPRHIVVSLSEAIQKDKKLLETLMDIIRGNPGIVISPYCVTEKFLSLIKIFEQHNLNFSIREMPICKNPYWLVSYLDSKVGSRMEVAKIKHTSVSVPESIVCRTTMDVADALTWFYGNGKSCAVKANFGESGWGLLLILKESFYGVNDAIRYVLAEFEKDSIWKDELILVEEYIESDGSRGMSPSTEIFIDDSGPKVTYLCDQVLGVNGDFLGIALGVDVLDEEIKKRIRITSLQIGKRFFEMGYRGFFDIDFMIMKDGKPVVIETNMRRTGGTHVYDAIRSLVGKSWESTVFALSRDSFKYGKKMLLSEDILGRMKNILYPINNQERGMIISIIDKNLPTFGFIIIGSSKNDVLRIYNQMLERLNIE